MMPDNQNPERSAPLTTMPAPAADLRAAKAAAKAQAIEKIRPELNLEKWSIWQPSKSKLGPTARVLRRQITLSDGSIITAEVEVGFTNRGALTTEDQKTYYALIKQWEDHNRPIEQVPFSLRHLARTLKKKWGTNVIESLTESLIRLRTIPFIWRNSYQDGSTGETVKLLDTYNILSDLRIVQREQDGTVNKAVGYFRFDDRSLKNLLANLTKPKLLEVVIDLKSEIGQMLYTHLDLVMDDKTLYERRTRELFEDLGLKGKAYIKPSKRKQMLTPALVELQGIPLSRGRITAATIEKTKDKLDYKVVFRKGHRANGAEPLTQNREVEQPSAEHQNPIALQAAELVKHFFVKFHAAEQPYISRKAIGQATSLIAAHGLHQAKYIVEYAHRVAPETDYKPQSFGGILHYTSRALAAQEEESRETLRRQDNERARRELAAKEEAQFRLEDSYRAYRKQVIEDYLDTSLSPEALAEMIETKKCQLLAEKPKLYSTWPAESFNNYALKMVHIELAKTIPMASFEEFSAQEQGSAQSAQPAIASED